MNQIIPGVLEKCNVEFEYNKNSTNLIIRTAESYGFRFVSEYWKYILIVRGIKIVKYKDLHMRDRYICNLFGHDCTKELYSKQKWTGSGFKRVYRLKKNP